MQSKNKAPQTRAESEHADRLQPLRCACCGAQGPSQVHEPEQGMWFIAVPLCQLCHTGPQGWHGTRLRWTLRKMTMEKAINWTIGQVFYDEATA